MANVRNGQRETRQEEEIRQKMRNNNEILNQKIYGGGGGGAINHLEKKNQKPFAKPATGFQRNQMRFHRFYFRFECTQRKAK